MGLAYRTKATSIHCRELSLPVDAAMWRIPVQPGYLNRLYQRWIRAWHCVQSVIRFSSESGPPWLRNRL